MSYFDFMYDNSAIRAVSRIGLFWIVIVQLLVLITIAIGAVAAFGMAANAVLGWLVWAAIVTVGGVFIMPQVWFAGVMAKDRADDAQ